MFFFFNDTATTEIYTLSLHDALPIFRRAIGAGIFVDVKVIVRGAAAVIGPAHGHLDRSVWMRGMVTCGQGEDRKSTRLNSSHLVISYAVFCLKKKKKISISYANTYSR